MQSSLRAESKGKRISGTTGRIRTTSLITHHQQMPAGRSRHRRRRPGLSSQRVHWRGQSATPHRPSNSNEERSSTLRTGRNADQIDGPTQFTGNSGPSSCSRIQPQFQSQAAPSTNLGRPFTMTARRFRPQPLRTGVQRRALRPRKIRWRPGRSKGRHQSTGLQFIHTLLKESQAIGCPAFLAKKIEQPVRHRPIGIKPKTQQFKTRDPTITAWRTGTCPNRCRGFFA